MMTNELSRMSISSLAKQIQMGQITSVQIVESCLDRAAQWNTELNAFVFIDEDHALEQARQLDFDRQHGQWLGPLHGIPVAVKDNYLVNGMPATACSNTRDAVVGTRDAATVARLKAAGAVILGKTNMHEWAYGATNEISSNGAVRNPWDVRRISGGSSGGSAAALAAGIVPAAMGSDTGGSVRIPSSACGVCGLKPTFGRVSVEGVLPLSWSLDVAGPMARSAEDLALLFDAIKKPLTTTPEIKHDELKSVIAADSLNGLKVATLQGPRLEYSEQVAEVFDGALSVFVESEAETKQVKLDTMVDGFAAWDTILHVEAAAYHSQTVEERADLFSDNVLSHLEAGRYIPGVSYVKAHQYRKLFVQQIERIFNDNHIIAIPTLPVTAPLIGSKQEQFSNVSVTPQDAMTYLAWLANFTYLPALSIPCGMSVDGLPVGMSLIGPAGSDSLLLKVGQIIQRQTNWHLQQPPMFDSQERSAGAVSEINS